jgi:RNA polymerase sigma factor (sigma-70 family)
MMNKNEFGVRRETRTNNNEMTFVDNPELHERGRVRQLMSQADCLLGFADEWSVSDEITLFKAMHACGYRLSRHTRARHASRGVRRAASRLRQRIVEALVNRNVGLVYEMRRRYRFDSVDSDDLTSEGLWTLFRAVSTFDPWRGFRFSTYACTSIVRGYLMLARKKQSDLERLSQVWTEQEDAALSESHAPQQDRNTDWWLDRLRRILSRNEAELTDIERFVVERRILHPVGERPDTLSSLGKILHLSKERVRQIQLAALDKLRGAMCAFAGERANANVSVERPAAGVTPMSGGLAA